MRKKWPLFMRKKRPLLCLYVPVLMIDTHHANILGAQAGLEGEVGKIFVDKFLHELDVANMGHAVALTANDEVKAFARNALGHQLERADTYHLVLTKQRTAPRS